MNQNRTLSVSLSLLSHPISVGAMLLLLFNDHILRINWPSWWTGKLGDFAWLFFFPYALGVVVALIIPARVPAQAGLVSSLAFGLTGGVFILVKMLPFFHSWFIRLASHFFGWQVALVRDPTDLIALVSLVPAWLLWKQKLHQPGIPTKRLSWTAVLCAAILTLANSALPDYGITCLSTQDGQLQAASSYQHYTSTDGGMTWQDTESQTIEGCSGYSFSTDEKAVTDPANPNRMIRYIPGVVVAYTQDGGLTWTSEYEVRPAHEADRFFYERTRSWNPRYAKPPFMAVFDQYNGNVVLAMGHEGVLVRQKSGAYLQVPVGIYHKPSRTNPGFLWKMLNGEIILALGFAGWVTAWSGRKARPSKIRTILLWLSVIAGCGLLVFVPPALQTLYLMTFAWMGTIIVITLILPLFLDEIIHAIRRSKQKIGVLALTFMISAVIFLIPYTLWVYKLLPYYRLAEIISAGLCIAYCNILTRLRFKWWEFETEADNKPTPSINDKINLLFPAVWLIGAVLILGSMYGLWRMNPDHAFWVSLVLMVVIIIVKIIAGIKKR